MSVVGVNADRDTLVPPGRKEAPKHLVDLVKIVGATLDGRHGTDLWMGRRYGTV